MKYMNLLSYIKIQKRKPKIKRTKRTKRTKNNYQLTPGQSRTPERIGKVTEKVNQLQITIPDAQARRAVRPNG
ncbi:MAG: hypothetical protein A3A51_04700 [Candidatus Levybacteria bacterium RIFCSPLOWO2_01_FULL_39_10]|nr:MAG: hypothetical protein A3A51_04700 [Candidatus Levybacteria bacterium RIFCSPLOWO2_01_FULL_39_10]